MCKSRGSKSCREKFGGERERERERERGSDAELR